VSCATSKIRQTDGYAGYKDGSGENDLAWTSRKIIDYIKALFTKRRIYIYLI